MHTSNGFESVNSKRGLKFCLLFFFIWSTMVYATSVFSDEWKVEKGEHFIIEYQRAEDSAWAKKVLREAEKYYDKIGRQIDYVRYQNFWTWEDRVKIIIYSNQETFLKETGQPYWSRGSAYRDEKVLQSRSIVSYKQENKFLDGVLPHEISHLILRDFVGFDKNVPVWFDEGVAQLQEKGKRQKVPLVMRDLIQRGQQFPLQELCQMDVRFEMDPFKVGVFYIQSLSLVDFLITRYGSNDFGRLCRELNSGKDFNGALRTVYHPTIESISELEKKWLSYMQY